MVWCDVLFTDKSASEKVTGYAGPPLAGAYQKKSSWKNGVFHKKKTKTLVRNSSLLWTFESDGFNCFWCLTQPKGQKTTTSNPIFIISILIAAQTGLTWHNSNCSMLCVSLPCHPINSPSSSSSSLSSSSSSWLYSTSSHRSSHHLACPDKRWDNVYDILGKI